MLPWTTATSSPARISGFSTAGRNPRWGSSCKQSTASSLKPLLTLTVVPHKLLFTLPSLTTILETLPQLQSSSPCATPSSALLFRHPKSKLAIPGHASMRTQAVAITLPMAGNLIFIHAQRTRGVPWFGIGARVYLKQLERLYRAVNIFWLSWHFTLLVLQHLITDFQIFGHPHLIQ